MENLINAITPYLVVSCACGTVAVFGVVLRDVVRTVIGVNALLKDILKNEKASK